MKYIMDCNPILPTKLRAPVSLLFSWKALAPLSLREQLVTMAQWPARVFSRNDCSTALLANAEKKLLRFKVDQRRVCYFDMTTVLRISGTVSDTLKRGSDASNSSRKRQAATISAPKLYQHTNRRHIHLLSDLTNFPTICVGAGWKGKSSET